MWPVSIFQDPTIEVKNIRERIHYVADYMTVASYHPLAVRRRPVLYRAFLQDWKLLVDQLELIGPRPPGQSH